MYWLLSCFADCMRVQLLPSFSVVVKGFLQMTIMFIWFFLLEQWYQCYKRLTDISDQSQIHFCTPTYLFASNIYLDNICTRRIELLIRKISAKHEQQVRIHN